MREIKFRAKRIDNGKWVYGAYCYNPLTDKAYIYAFDAERSFVYLVDPKTVGQFTGLLDKNGKEIYEGDILKYIDPFNRKEVDHIEGEVIFASSHYSIHCQGADETEHFIGWLIKTRFAKRLLFYCDVFEVIGNIYENPELLAEKK